MSDEDVGCLLAHHHATLLYSRQHGVAGYSTLPVRKATDADILGHPQTHALGSIKDADGRIVIDGKETVRTILHLQDFWRNSLSISTVVTKAHQCIVRLYVMLEQGIPVAVVSVLGNLQCHGRAIERNTVASRFY